MARPSFSTAPKKGVCQSRSARARARRLGRAKHPVAAAVINRRPTAIVQTRQKQKGAREYLQARREKAMHSILDIYRRRPLSVRKRGRPPGKAKNENHEPRAALLPLPPKAWARREEEGGEEPADRRRQEEEMLSTVLGRGTRYGQADIYRPARKGGARHMATNAREEERRGVGWREPDHNKKSILR